MTVFRQRPSREKVSRTDRPHPSLLPKATENRRLVAPVRPLSCHHPSNEVDWRPPSIAGYFARNTLRNPYGGRLQAVMFDKNSLDALFDELRDSYELEPDWEDIQRAAHLGVARLDAGVEIGEIDYRVAEAVQKHNPG